MSLKVNGREDGVGEERKILRAFKGLFSIFLMNLPQGKSLSCFTGAQLEPSLSAGQKFSPKPGVLLVRWKK